jgi:hypothetical protein
MTQAWLDYCKRVVSDKDHATLCASLGGSTPAAGVYPSNRWPGYVGERYAEGKLLWINIVHRDMIERWNGAEAARLAAATTAWSAGEIGDDDYLAANRAGYQAALGPNGWTVGRAVRKLTSALNWELGDVAYANAARCQVVPTGSYAEVQDRLVMFCQGWLPIRELVAILRPGLVYV